MTYCREQDLPTRAEEKLRYKQHQNGVEDQGYVAYLDTLLVALERYVAEESEGLDFGCGQESVLRQLLARRNRRMEIWDPIFHPDPSALRRKYQFITATEVVEHFHYPRRSFAKIDKLLEAGGIFGLLTQVRPEDTPFRDWAYARDKTHVSFYTQETFEEIAKIHSWELLFCQRNAGVGSAQTSPTAVIFRKRAEGE